MVAAQTQHAPHRVVIIGGGFGGLYTAKALGNASVDVTLVDKRNFHLFQPLLYQVATGTLSPGDIASPLRGILKRNRNTKVLLDEAIDLKPEENKIVLREQELEYDSLIVATGVSHHYFGNDHWQDVAPGLKTVEDALAIRQKIYRAFEEAEKEKDPERQQALLNFVVVGGGPTGVELSGAIAEIAYKVLKEDFHHIDTRRTNVYLLEGMDRVLPPYDPSLSAKAKESLEKLGVQVNTSTLVTNIEDDLVTMKQGDNIQEIRAHNIFWAAGVKASAMGEIVSKRTGAELDRAGRVVVEPDLSVKNYGNIFVIGDLANFPHQGDRPLPGVAPVAMQEGEYVANLIKRKVENRPVQPFEYVDFGSLAVIGQNAAVVDLGFIKFSGFFAWLVWIFAHVYYLIEFDNKLLVMTQWAWHYFVGGKSARLITGDDFSVNSLWKLRSDYYNALADEQEKEEKTKAQV